jgi:hypothetical protein
MLRKKGIKGNVTDGPIIEHPRFGRIQWNQSCSHMPKVAPETEPEMMDMDEPAAPAEPVEPKERRQKISKKKKSMKRQSRSEPQILHALQDTLEDMRFQIISIQRDARQDRLETQDMLRAILDRLPPASGTSSAPPP